MSLKNQIKLIVSDLDGTLLDDNKVIDSNIKNIIKLLKYQGIFFTIATGRNYNLTLDIIKELEIDLPYICDNGGSIYQYEDSVLINEINNKYLFDIIKKLDEYNASYIVYSTKSLFTHNLSDRLNFFVSRVKNIKKVNDLNEMNNDSIIKITVDSKNIKGIKKLVFEVNEISDCVNFKKSEDTLYTITDIDATKGKALAFLLNKLNISKENVMAIGDNFNDVSLLEESMVKVSMKNSQDVLRNISDYVIGDNNEDGVSKFIKEYFKL